MRWYGWRYKGIVTQCCWPLWNRLLLGFSYGKSSGRSWVIYLGPAMVMFGHCILKTDWENERLTGKTNHSSNPSSSNSQSADTSDNSA